MSKSKNIRVVFSCSNKRIIEISISLAAVISLTLIHYSVKPDLMFILKKFWLSMPEDFRQELKNQLKTHQIVELLNEIEGE